MVSSGASSGKWSKPADTTGDGISQGKDLFVAPQKQLFISKIALAANTA
jgi:hypothetical protein